VQNNNAFGSLDSNPYKFEDFGLKTLTVSVNNSQFRYPPFVVSWGTTKRVGRAYYNLFLAGAQNNSYNGPGITFEQFKKGGSILFPIDASDAKNSGSFQPTRHGTVKLDLLFDTALPEAVSVFVYAEFTGTCVSIDRYMQASVGDVEEEIKKNGYSGN